jgi:hypothetical protein
VWHLLALASLFVRAYQISTHSTSHTLVFVTMHDCSKFSGLSAGKIGSFKLSGSLRRHAARWQCLLTWQDMHDGLGGKGEGKTGEDE